MGEAPAPFVSADIDVRDLDGFMLNVERLLASELWALTRNSPEAFRGAAGLWCRAWKQVPAGSLPDDDQILAAFADMPLARFKKMRALVMRGFVLCSDGRFYHKVLCEDVMRAAERKAEYAAEREADRERLRNWREAKRRERARRNGVETGVETCVETEGETGVETAKETEVKPVSKRQRNGDETSNTGQGPKVLRKQESVSNSESEAARENVKKLNGGSSGRSAPAAVAALKREQLSQKLMRYCNARLSDAERGAAMIGLMGEDAKHDEQWWFDNLDKRMRKERWDDKNQPERTSP